MSCRSISRCKGDAPPFLFVDRLSAPNVLFNFTEVFKCTVCILFRLCLQLIDNSSACYTGLLFVSLKTVGDAFSFCLPHALLSSHTDTHTHEKKQKNPRVRRTRQQVDTISSHTYTEPHTDMLEGRADVNIYRTVT